MSLPEAEVAVEIERETRGAVLIGAVPSFDEETLAGMLYRHGLCPTWHYHLVDVETLAAGALRMPPRWDFDSVLAAYGLTYDEADRHTALGDARMVRDLYDAVMQRPTK
jgi:DNA polymerase III epsilon subunit-like protein